MNHPVFDAYSVDLDSLISYDASAVGSMHLYMHEYIDNLHFLRAPSDIIADRIRCTSLIHAVEVRFREAGWEGTGKVSILWLPSFVFPHTKPSWEGAVIWHVKQHEDGLSWMLSPTELPFAELG